MSANIIDGKAFAATVREKVASKVADLKNTHNITPGLAVVLVGKDPASQVYVRSKGKQTVEVGMNSVEHKLDTDTTEEALLALIDQFCFSITQADTVYTNVNNCRSRFNPITRNHLRFANGRHNNISVTHNIWQIHRS